MNRYKLTVLVENTARKRGLLAEHGLSFWIETEDCKILFDAGQSDALQHNAKELGIDLASADAIILSHGHYDHTGGFAYILDEGISKPLFAHPDAFKDKYALNADGTSRYIGINPEIRLSLKSKSEVRSVLVPTEVCEGIFVTGPIPRLTDFEDTGGQFFKDEACSQVDDLIDDQAAFVDTPDGLVVILGCAHSGIINTLQYIKELCPDRPFRAVIGGTHLVNASETRIHRTFEMLRELDVRQIFPLHCTGFVARARLWKEFPDRVEEFPVGAVFEF